MSKCRQIILICTLLAVAGGMAFCFLQQREPQYQDKSLSIWLKDFDRWDGDTNAPAVQALRTMGAEAAPILARAILRKDSALKRKIIAKLEQLLKHRFTTDSEQSRRAETALTVTGQHARVAAPIFLKALTSDDEFLRRKALYGFALLGPQSEDYLPTIINLEHDSEVSVRINLIVALGRIGRRLDLCKPVLLRAVEDSDSWVRHLAVVALAEFGSEAEPTKVVTKANEPIMHSATDSLQKVQADE